MKNQQKLLFWLDDGEFRKIVWDHYPFVVTRASDHVCGRSKHISCCNSVDRILWQMVAKSSALYRLAYHSERSDTWILWTNNINELIKIVCGERMLYHMNVYEIKRKRYSFNTHGIEIFKNFTCSMFPFESV